MTPPGQSDSRWAAFTDDEIQALHWALEASDDETSALLEELEEELRENRGYAWANGWVKR